MRRKSHGIAGKEKRRGGWWRKGQAGRHHSGTARRRTDDVSRVVQHYRLPDQAQVQLQRACLRVAGPHHYGVRLVVLWTEQGKEETRKVRSTKTYSTCSSVQHLLLMVYGREMKGVSEGVRRR
jgi:hypothetical protein